MDDFPFYGHDDDHEDAAWMPDESNPVWASERLELNSVGIDIGSSTSHLMFSLIVLRRQGLSLSSRFKVVQRKTTYESRVLLTPYVEGTTIDTEALSAFIDAAYQEAGVTPEKIDTGAVIITGEAARKENAESIANLFSAHAGKFVCATAGPNLEAMMAVCGSGALERSMAEDEGGLTIMNVDVGGGTSKIAIARDGQIVDTAAINVGARLIAMDESGQIVRIEDAGRLVAEKSGIKLSMGGTLSTEEKQRMAKDLAVSLFEMIKGQGMSPLTRELMITAPLSYKGKIDGLLFSGGVSEYIYGHEKANFGDLGEILASQIVQQVPRPELDIPVHRPAQGIRATVIGASQYTVQVSGSTIFISHPDLLPLRNIQVLTPKIEGPNLTEESIQTAIQDSLRRFDTVEGERPIALALHWPWGPSYRGLKTLAQGILAALKNTLQKKMPIILVFDTDIGKLTGNILSQELSPGAHVVSIDGIYLQDFDYVDIGEELPVAGVVPVVIKSLIFRETDRLSSHAPTVRSGTKGPPQDSTMPPRNV